MSSAYIRRPAGQLPAATAQTLITAARRRLASASSRLGGQRRRAPEDRPLRAPVPRSAFTAHRAMRQFFAPAGLRRWQRLRRARWQPYRSDVDFSDSTFAALNLPEVPFDWGRMLVLALVLTLAAASAGILAGGLLA
jgi:hypothetical protein